MHLRFRSQMVVWLGEDLVERIGIPPILKERFSKIQEFLQYDDGHRHRAVRACENEFASSEVGRMYS